MGKYVIEPIILEKGSKVHLKIESDSLNFTFEYGEEGKTKTYNVEEGGLYQLKKRLGKRHFFIIFRKDEPNHLELKPKLERSPYILRRIKKSKAVRKALAKEFRSPFEMRRILFIGLVIIIGIVVYFVMQQGGFV